jgi:prepilin-type N-terminal cleavage/methylation domain-containing protein
MSDESGFTLVELLISAALMTVILLATLSVTDAFQRHSVEARVRLDSRDDVRTATDRIAKRIRPVIEAPNGMVELAGATDLVYQVVGGTAPGGTDTNKNGAQRLRYCLNTTDGKVYRQQTTWTGAAPALPTQPQPCPSTAYATTGTVLAQAVSNGARPLFTYDFRNGSTDLGDVTGLTVSLFVDANGSRPPGEAGLTTSIALRNTNQAPTAAFTDAVVNGHILANASSSADPEGASLTYAWFVDGATTAASNDVRLDVGGLLRGSTHTVELEVTDSGGLTNRTPPKSFVMP